MGFIPILPLFAICDSLLCLQELGAGFLLDVVGRRVCVTEEQCHRRDRHLVVAQKVCVFKQKRFSVDGLWALIMQQNRSRPSQPTSRPRLMSNDGYHCKLSELGNKSVQLLYRCLNDLREAVTLLPP